MEEKESRTKGRALEAPAEWEVQHNKNMSVKEGYRYTRVESSQQKKENAILDKVWPVWLMHIVNTSERDSVTKNPAF